MKDFIQLYKNIDSTTKTNSKINALVEYFKLASDKDKLWTVAIFTHRRPPRAVTTTLLRAWAAEKSNLPLWLFEDTYHIVGDLAETIALVLPPPIKSEETTSLSTIIEEQIELKAKDIEEKKSYVLLHWQRMNVDERFLFNKIITGGFRIGISQKNMVKAVAQFLSEDENKIAHRLMGNWTPMYDTWQSLIVEGNEEENDSKPYPFYLAYPLEGQPDAIGSTEDWIAEWKWDGIRGQLIKRNGEIYLWSRGEELVTDKYPEFQQLKEWKEDNFVLDGEIIGIVDGRPLPFSSLQTRIGRKTLSKKILKEIPIGLIAYDILEYDSKDIRGLPLAKRKTILRTLINHESSVNNIQLSEVINFKSWQQLGEIRSQSSIKNAEGLILKKSQSSYGIGRKKGDWWKWKVDAMEVDAVMIYAQRGHGRRANLFTDFTFAVWDGHHLVPFCKAYSGLSDAEFNEISTFVKENTIERFGPVHSVPAALVFTIAFEGVSISKRHKAGIALRFPRISRWRKDKKVVDIDQLTTLRLIAK